MTSKCIRVIPKSFVAKLFNFFNQTVVEMYFGACVNQFVESRHAAGEARRRGFCLQIPAVRFCCFCEFRKPCPGLEISLKSSLVSRIISWEQTRCRLRIEPRQQSVQMLGTLFLAYLCQTLFGVSCRLEDPQKEASEVSEDKNPFRRQVLEPRRAPSISLIFSVASAAHAVAVYFISGST